MTTFVIHMTCPNGHKQNLRLEGFTEQAARDYTGLLDGSSPMYVYPPKAGDGSVIGKCSACFQAGTEVMATCEVVREDHN